MAVAAAASTTARVVARTTVAAKADKHYAYKDRDHNDHGNFHNRHRVFRNGAWIWVYGSGYTAYGDDCYWLRRQAIITGSPYWWDRYNACVGYDYY